MVPTMMWTRRFAAAGRAASEADSEDWRWRDQAEEDDGRGGQKTDARPSVDGTAHSRTAAKHVRRSNVPRRRHSRSRYANYRVK